MGLTIGQLANKAGINVETIRYYERRGLIKRPVKPASGYRQYNKQALQKLLFIKRAKNLGFKLDEIGSLLNLSSEHCGEVKSLAEEKLVHVNNKISDLQGLAEVLGDLVRQCNNSADRVHCPIIETLLNEQKTT
jgi:MerR family mercuric resistance operon transcriptional regulator